MHPIPDIKAPTGASIRYTIAQDSEWLAQWLLDPADPDVRIAYPMDNPTEIDDAVRRWISFSRLRSSLTIEYEGKPIGLAALYLQSYKRLLHQTDFGIIIAREFRGKGMGSFLLSSIMKLAQHLGIELIHLQVHEGNPAIELYTKFGFVEFGRQNHWLKEPDGYRARIFMERDL